MPVKAKYIKDLPLKRVLDGSESLLVQDLNGTQQAPLEVIVDEIKQNSQEKIREIESELAQTNAQLSTIEQIQKEGYVVANPTNLTTLIEIYNKIYLSDGIYTEDIRLRKNMILLGSNNKNAHISGQLHINSNCILKNLKLGGNEKNVCFENNTTDVTISECYFTQGTSNVSVGASLYVNDINLNNVKINDCTFENCNYNGVKIVGKGSSGYVSDITFTNCLFKSNIGMNFECIDRGSDDVGYKNVNLIGCTLIKDNDAINVSYDSRYYLTENGTKDFVGGNSTISHCYIRGGKYALELAGAKNMLIEHSDIIDGVEFCVSSSHMEDSYNNTRFIFNTVKSSKDSVFCGSNLTISNNKLNDSNVIVSGSENSIISDNYLIPITYKPNKSLLELRRCSNLIVKDNTFDCSSINQKNQDFIGVYYSNTNIQVHHNHFIRPLGMTGGYNVAHGLGANENETNYFNNKLNTFPVSEASFFKDIIKQGEVVNRRILNLQLRELKGHPCLLITLYLYGRHNNSTVFSEVKVIFGNYDLPNAKPLILQTSPNTLNVDVNITGEDSSIFSITMSEDSVYSSLFYVARINTGVSLSSGANDFIIL